MYNDDSRNSRTPQRRSSFAHQMTLEQFGRLGHLHDGQWADYVDIGPDDLAEKRCRAIWGQR